MPVQQSDIRIYASAGVPLSDTATPVGGAIDTTTEMLFSNIIAKDNLQVVSSNAADTTQSVVITGRNANGAIVTETLSLAGMTVVPCVTTISWSSLLAGQKQASCQGVVAVEALTAQYAGAISGSTGQFITLSTAPLPTISLNSCVLRVTAGTGAGTIALVLTYDAGTGVVYVDRVLGIDNTSVVKISYGMVFRQNVDGNTTEVMTVRRPFYNAAAPAPQQPIKTLLEKVFIYNTNDVLTLNNVQLQQLLQDNVTVSIGVDAAVSASTAAAGNRTGAAPVPMFTGTPVAVPGTALPTNTGIGVWLQLTLLPGASAVEAPLSLQIQGI